MSSGIFTPTNQVKLTNVAVVRLKKCGKRFEIACYRNKVSDYRNRTTKNLDEVLQSRQVFLNVSKGQLARESDLKAAFDTANTEKVILEILDHGEVQVGSAERDNHLSNLTREVATMVCDRVINPSTRKAYPVAVIEQAMSEIVHFSPNPTRSAKQQALDVIKVLEANSHRFPIARTPMRISICCSLHQEVPLITQIAPMMLSSERQVHNDTVRITCSIEPQNYRPIGDAAKACDASVELISHRDF